MHPTALTSVPALQGFRYWVRTPTPADLHPEPPKPPASKHSMLPELRSLTSDLGIGAQDVASMAAAALSGYHPVRKTNKDQGAIAEVYTPGQPYEPLSRHENGVLNMPPINPWQLDPGPSFPKASRMTGPWDSATSISSSLDAATKSASPVFFLHGVGLGIVRTLFPACS